MCQHGWPGNVRELRNTVERMVVLARGDTLTVRDLPAAIRAEADQRNGRHDLSLPAAPGGAGTAIQPLDETEKQVILNALERCGGNKSRAAQDLGISRRTLHRKLNRYKADQQDATRGAAGDGEGTHA